MWYSFTCYVIRTTASSWARSLGKGQTPTAVVQAALLMNQLSSDRSQWSMLDATPLETPYTIDAVKVTREALGTTAAKAAQKTLSCSHNWPGLTE